MFNIVLVEPEIPGNTGNIARTCVVTGSRLHLVEPMGFSIDEKQVRRAGLDYWDKLDLTVYRDLDTFREENKCKGTFWYFSTKAGKVFS
ncbi:MAG: tRNA (uridine(34)/cytosine(34)/5-carboxymethylaminomethyluridine(34)-2'-O)-methyltransferase TrmL, partial [Clostridia bacterium]|nr:tRNA (uridine(34)/cytosine(34)/5-carboxymethylaminomethyluridine(34)-2'-O)-methyltransferase TrmL [Clostridia bacterium]